MTNESSAVAALRELVAIIDAAGLLNLSNGVHLGRTVWYCKAVDCMDAARAALSAAPVSPPENRGHLQAIRQAAAALHRHAMTGEASLLYEARSYLDAAAALAVQPQQPQQDQGASPAGTACSGPSAPEPKVSALRVPPAGAESFVRDLLWNEHPECCGKPVVGAEYMGSTEMVCCGCPEPSPLNDAQIVASLRERFPEAAAAEPAQSIADHLFIDQRGDGIWLVCVEKVHESMEEAQQACCKWQAATAQPVAVTDEMVTRFLGWPLPKTFAPDCGITFEAKVRGIGSVPPSDLALDSNADSVNQAGRSGGGVRTDAGGQSGGESA